MNEAGAFLAPLVSSGGFLFLVDVEVCLVLSLLFDSCVPKLFSDALDDVDKEDERLMRMRMMKKKSFQLI
jgi:hypothetical protein